MQNIINNSFDGFDDVQNHKSKFEFLRNELVPRKPLSSICFNHSLAAPSLTQKDSLKKLKKRSAGDVGSKQIINQNGENEKNGKANKDYGIFRKTSEEAIKLWRDEWNLNLANNIEDVDDTVKTLYPKESIVDKLYDCDVVDASNLEGEIGNRMLSLNNFQNIEPSDDFWSVDFEDLLTLRIANPIDESDEE